MAPVWDWLRDRRSPTRQDPAFLNLFGYTGVGSQALAAAGASVTHVDASKKSVSQARENAALAGMADKPIRWIVDDAGKFTAREVRREKRYDAILLDPPKFGRGPKGANAGSSRRARAACSPTAASCSTPTAARCSSPSMRCACRRWRSVNCLNQLFADLPGKVECGELAVREEARGLLLPTAIFARWSR